MCLQHSFLHFQMLMRLLTLVMTLLGCIRTGEVSHAERVGVAIIGGGVSGLTAAKTLLESDVEDLLILEAKERLGGRVHTVREGNVVVEAGAEWIHGDEKNPLYRLAEELDALAPPPPEDWDFLTVTHYGKMADMDYYLELQELVSEFGDNASYLAPYEGLGLDAFFTDRYKSMFGEESTEEWKGWLHYLSKIVGSNFGCNDWATPEVTTTGAFEEYGEDNQWASGYDTLPGPPQGEYPRRQHSPVDSRLPHFLGRTRRRRTGRRPSSNRQQRRVFSVGGPRYLHRVLWAPPRTPPPVILTAVAGRLRERLGGHRAGRGQQGANGVGRPLVG
ncbi:uncharacterized protein [Penaeus vannamei]|uniref:uncharacterized protein isoform X2 n=1 Tax=Penaeus vannamei TaxID=6689 RepID=UPI00387F4568